jgi:hypothetical protein
MGYAGQAAEHAEILQPRITRISTDFFSHSFDYCSLRQAQGRQATSNLKEKGKNKKHFLDRTSTQQYSCVRDT